MYSYSKIAQTLQKKTTRYYPATSWYIVNYSEIGQTLQKRTTRYYLVPTSWDIVKYSKIGKTFKTTRCYPPIGTL